MAVASVAGYPGARPVHVGGLIAFLTTGSCTVQCIAGGVVSADHGATWTPLPATGRVLAGLVATPDGHLVRMQTTTEGVITTSVLSSLGRSWTTLRDVTPAGPALGDLSWPSLLAVAGSEVALARDVDTLVATGDAGATWHELPAR